MMQATINEIKNSAVFLDDPNDILLEDAIGSDVAQVQSTESNINPSDDDSMDQEDDSQPSLPLHYSFVLPSCHDDSLNNAIKLTAFQKW